MTQYVEKLRENYQSVQARIQRACDRVGRDREDVTLIAVTKYAKNEWIEALWEIGETNFGENYPQQLTRRAMEFKTGFPTWHMIGHLQSNKVKSVLQHTVWIHSVDSVKLLREVVKTTDRILVEPQVLLEVNVTGEPSKEGFTPKELLTSWPKMPSSPSVAIRGLMTMAAASADPETSRPAFRALRELLEELRLRDPLSAPLLTDLSMGMSGDFEVAIEEGATFVRVGSALFEGLE